MDFKIANIGKWEITSDSTFAARVTWFLAALAVLLPCLACSVALGQTAAGEVMLLSTSEAGPATGWAAAAVVAAEGQAALVAQPSASVPQHAVSRFLGHPRSAVWESAQLDEESALRSTVMMLWGTGAGRPALVGNQLTGNSTGCHS